MFLLLKPYIPWSFSSFSMMISLHYLNFMTFTNTDDSKISYKALLHFPILHVQLSPRYLHLVSYRHFRPKRSKAWLHFPPPSLSPTQEMASESLRLNSHHPQHLPGLTLTPIQSTHQIQLLHPRSILGVHLRFSHSITTAEIQAIIFSSGFYQLLSCLPITNSSLFWNSFTEKLN